MQSARPMEDPALFFPFRGWCKKPSRQRNSLSLCKSKLLLLWSINLIWEATLRDYGSIYWMVNLQEEYNPHN